MNRESKKIKIKEFIDQGYLQEVNRLFFHPLGLALGVTKNTKVKDSDYELDCIWDCRADPEGITFALDDPNCTNQERIDRFQKNAKRIKKLKDKLALVRKQKLGYEIEPIPKQAPK